MPHSRLRRVSLLGLVLGLALCQADPARASAFTVHPIRVVISPDTRSALLTLHNQSSEALRFQLSMFAWDQSLDSEMQLTPSDDIVFFPSLLTLAPDETRNIRVGPATSFAPTEKTYRIFVEELPPLGTPEQGAAGVRILTRMGIPIFLQPAQAVQRGRIEGIAVRGGRLSFQVKNTGNVHFVEQAVRVRGFGPAGDKLFEHQLAGWYVLADGFRAHELELPKVTCAKIRALAVEVQTEWATFQERLDIPSGACGR